LNLEGVSEAGEERGTKKRRKTDLHVYPPTSGLF